MKIGIIGSGNIGATTARLFAGAGHDVTIANSRGPESLAELVQDIGPRPARERSRTRPGRATSSWSPSRSARIPTFPLTRSPGRS